MSAAIAFLSAQGFTIYEMAGSGLGFYGSGSFGAAVRVGEFQDNTYITDSTGAIQGPLVNNVKYVHPYSGLVSPGNALALNDIPNYLAPLNVRFTNDTPVKVQNAQLRIFDRSNINAPASGVTTYAAELVHPWNTSQPTGPLGSGSTTWSHLGGSGGLIGGVTYDPPLAMKASPGVSGLSPSGSATVSAQHDWYVALSASPDSVGSKLQYGLYFSCEYL
jgi:hypothetical protein